MKLKSLVFLFVVVFAVGIFAEMAKAQEQEEGSVEIIVTHAVYDPFLVIAEQDESAVQQSSGVEVVKYQYRDVMDGHVIVVREGDEFIF